MKVIIYYGGNKKGKNMGKNEESDLLIDLLQFRHLNMERVPEPGETLMLYLDRYQMSMTVVEVFPHHCPPGNPYIIEKLWGDFVGVEVDNAEIEQVYGEGEEV